MNKTGLLLPRSVLYPTLSFDMLEGVRSGLAALGVNDVEIRTDNIGVAANKSAIYSVCEKMLFDGITVIAGYVPADTAVVLQPLMESAGATLIALDSGYQFAGTNSLLKNVYTLSLQGTLACRLTGRKAARNGDTKIAFAGSFLDAGYRAGYGFYNGLYDNGGTITFNHVTKLKREEFTIEALTDHLQQNPEVALFASFCGDMAQDFCAGALAAGLFAKHQGYCTPFMAEETWLDKIPYPGGDIKTCVPWARSLESAANSAFKTALKNKKRAANIFSLLGWETAYLLREIFNTENNDDITGRLEGLSFDGPRGTVKMDAATHQCIAPMYDATIIKDETNGNCALQPGAIIADMEDDLKKYDQEVAAFTEGTSWYNAYPCLDS